MGNDRRRDGSFLFWTAEDVAWIRFRIVFRSTFRSLCGDRVLDLATGHRTIVGASGEHDAGSRKVRSSEHRSRRFTS